jgi:type I restriction enzyme S subunit
VAQATSPTETAAQLLARLRAEKAQRVKEKKIAPPKPLPPIKPAEIPFELPEGWVWCRLGELLNKFSTGPFGSMLHKSDYVPNGIPLVNPTNIKENVIYPNEKMMINAETKKRLSKYVLNKGDIVIARRGDLSKCAIIGEKEDGWLCGTGSFFLQLSKELDKEYFILVLISSYFQKQLTATSVGQTMDNLNQKILNGSLYALPPLAEQQAIVAKVERLLAVVAELAGQNLAAQEQAGQLMQAVLKEAFQSNGG